MFKKGDVLTSPADFDNAVFFALSVEVWQNGRRVQVGGQVTKHTEDDVYLGYDDEAYNKHMFVFRVR